MSAAALNMSSVSFNPFDILSNISPTFSFPVQHSADVKNSEYIQNTIPYSKAKSFQLNSESVVVTPVFNNWICFLHLFI